MAVIPITIFFSLLLAGLFIALFAHEQRRRRFASPERDSLLPLADEQTNEAPLLKPALVEAHDEAETTHEHHHHAKGACGCLDGSRPPCAGCRRRHAT